MNALMNGKDVFAGFSMAIHRKSNLSREFFAWDEWCAICIHKNLGRNDLDRDIASSSYTSKY